LLWKRVSIPGKGRGLVANRKIKIGTRVLSEEPLFAKGISDWEFTSKDTLNFYLRNLQSLHPFDFMSYLELHSYVSPSRKASFEQSRQVKWDRMNPHEWKLLGIFWANHIDTLLFLQGSFFNHSCMPNVFFSWNHNTSRGNFHALRDVERGEELCISYLPKYWYDISQRQEFLEQSYGFKCTCELCVDTELAQKRAKKRAILLPGENILYLQEALRPGLLGDWKRCREVVVKMANALGNVPSARCMDL
jgi:hypothetical protein